MIFGSNPPERDLLRSQAVAGNMRRMRVTAAFPPWHARSAAEVVERLEVTTLPGTAISARPPPPVRIDHGDVVRQVVGYQGGPERRRHPNHIDLSSVVDQTAQQVNEEEERRRDRCWRHRREVENDVSLRAARGGTKLLPNLADELGNATMQGSDILWRHPQVDRILVANPSRDPFGNGSRHDGALFQLRPCHPILPSRIDGVNGTS